jgi:hypothetical protein
MLRKYLLKIGKKNYNYEKDIPGFSAVITCGFDSIGSREIKTIGRWNMQKRICMLGRKSKKIIRFIRAIRVLIVP